MIDSVVRSSIWRVVGIEWGEAVKNKTKLEWRRRELANSRDREKRGEDRRRGQI